eukprot:Nitzschia sp. Nitz4//scaffold1_size375055//309170//310572//NITZ4_000324-RA/size375055-processed-gene-0.389-mRNA-1//1//CDS//3329541189//3316//frame0
MAPNIRQVEPAPIRDEDNRIRCGILGCGMMGQEHISYVMGYSRDIRIDFLCDPCEESLVDEQKVMKEFQDGPSAPPMDPVIFDDEAMMFQHAAEIDLLVIASPNYMHTPTLLRWGKYDISILCEKPVAVSQEQHDALLEASNQEDWKARIWVAMEYRYIPAVAKLMSLLPEIGDLKMVTIRENRYPFLHKVGNWNRDQKKTGDTLVEKCCHFFDLFRLITGQEGALSKVRALAQRGINYEDEVPQSETPIIDSAYVTMPFQERETSDKVTWANTIGCLELCMFAEGSRHQEEIIVTGSKGRLEAFMPENKVYMYKRPTASSWVDRSVPPPPQSIEETIFDCSDVKSVHGIDYDIPEHNGYHYCSTAVEWYHLLTQIETHRRGGKFVPQVSLTDGLRAVELGVHATRALVNDIRET